MQKKLLLAHNSVAMAMALLNAQKITHAESDVIGEDDVMVIEPKLSDLGIFEYKGRDTVPPQLIEQTYYDPVRAVKHNNRKYGNVKKCRKKNKQAKKSRKINRK